MNERRALYPGTFDPVTLGHLDILQRALNLFDTVTVTVAEGNRSTLFSLDERVAMLRDATTAWPSCDVVPFAGLLVAEMGRLSVHNLVRGIRSMGDYEHERAMAGVNRRLFAECETVFLLARPDLAMISSSLVREVARHGGDVSSLVPPGVAKALATRFQVENP